MRIACISDLHFGFGTGTERENECWEGAEEAFEKAMTADLVLIAGDIFDTRIPRPEHWGRAMELLSKFKTKSNDVKVLEVRGRGPVPDETLRGIPVLAIHGTHERRSEHITNPVESLERGGFLIHLHTATVVLEIRGERVAVHGMSGVPERYAKDVLLKWNPKPVENAFNIFMLHQSIDPYIYSPLEPPSLKLEDMPEGFDLYVAGHIHWHDLTEVKGKPFMIPGSTVITQMNKIESKQRKGFYMVDTGGGIDFIELERTRPFIYREIDITGKKPSEITEMIERELGGIQEERKPLVHLKLQGTLPKGVGRSDLDMSGIRKGFSDRMILKITMGIREEKLEEKLQLLRSIREQKASIEEIGFAILRKNMEELGSKFEYEKFFEMLVEGETDRVVNELLKDKSDNPPI
ncbi:MAG: hypothetical protein DRP11_02995 [Candidatus Aenigmatarchaeota archaeon]|nr:MAG: hypothetical protein DRP11_02995 [Candidatus Aenigmarchaeota archaeon]